MYIMATNFYFFHKLLGVHVHAHQPMPLTGFGPAIFLLFLVFLLGYNVARSGESFIY
jgi:hypothetical protein